MARAMLSFGMLSARAARIAARWRGFIAGSGRAVLAATASWRVGSQARFHRGVGQAHLGRDGDFARELAEHLRLDGVLPPLAVHDVLELGMAGQGSLRERSNLRFRRAL